jgi:heme A synthase
MQNSRFKTYAWATLWANIGVILWGAVVRATGSGAGCGSDWPDCGGEIIPRSPSTETLIEFSHRLTSGLGLLMVVGLIIWAYRAFPPRHRVRRSALASMLLMLSEAAVGAGLVLFELVAENESIARALFMGTHLSNTFLLLAALTLTAYWSTGEGRLSFADRRLTRLSMATLSAAILIGISGAIAALGDTLYPPSSHGEVIERAFSSTATFLTQLRILHPLIAICASLLILYLVAEVRRVCTNSQARRQASRLSILVFVQIIGGGINIYLRAPILLQVAHLLVADLVWICLVLTVVSALEESPP